jgi:hypothetical protein
MTPYYSHNGIQIFHGDCGEILSALPLWCESCSCELVGDAVAIHLAAGHATSTFTVVTDPPYGIGRDRGMDGGGYDGFGKKAVRVSRRYEGGWDDTPPSAELLRSIVESGDTAIVWGGQYFTDALPKAKKWLVWDKQQTMPTYSDAELAWTTLSGVSTKMFRYCGAGLMAEEQDRFHPTQKPVALMRWCISLCPPNAARILDPFAGVGSTLIAAKQVNRPAIGIEIEERYCEIAAKRLSQEMLPLAAAPELPPAEQTELLP